LDNLVFQQFNLKASFHLFQPVFFDLVLPSELTDTLDDLSAVVKSKVEQLEDKLVKAKSILERVNEFKVSGHYLRSQEIETARENSSKKVKAAIVLHEAIESVKNDRGHLSLEEIKDMTALAENIKSNLSLVI
jgi:ribosome biogenesis GTPase A